MSGHTRDHLKWTQPHQIDTIFPFILVRTVCVFVCGFSSPTNWTAHAPSDSQDFGLKNKNSKSSDVFIGRHTRTHVDRWDLRWWTRRRHRWIERKKKNCNQMKRHLPCHSMKHQAVPGTKLKKKRTEWIKQQWINGRRSLNANERYLTLSMGLCQLLSS